MSSKDETFEVTDAGASKTEKVESQRLKNGSLVMIKGNPCRVIEVSTAKPGKHGSAKVILKGRDVLSAKVYECTYHAGDMVDAPICKKTEYTLLNIDGSTLEVLDHNGEVKSDVNLPDAEHLKDTVKTINQIFEDGKRECLVTILNCMGTELCIEVREGGEV